MSRRFSSAEVQLMQDMRAKGATVIAIAARLNRTTSSLYAKFEQLEGRISRKNDKRFVPLDGPRPPPVNRPPLPAGHADTWGLISDQPWPGL